MSISYQKQVIYEFYQENEIDPLQSLLQPEKIKDQLNIHYLSTWERDICNHLASNNKIRHNLFRFTLSEKKKKKKKGF